jgi:hypothetical protein
MRRWDRRGWGCLDGPESAMSSTRHVRAEREEGVPKGVHKGTQGVPMGYSRVLKGKLQSGIQALLEVVKGAPHGTQGTKEAHTRRGRWPGCPCADARAAMDRTTKSRREYSSSTPPVEPVRRALPCSVVRPSCDVPHNPRSCTVSDARTRFLTRDFATL